MTEKPIYLTREGKSKLEVELEELKTTGRSQVADRIKAAKELGDISESGEYEDAKNSQALLEGRIREIEHMLSRAQLIGAENGDAKEVRVGSSVTVRLDDGEEETWTIVGAAEARPREGKISNESPIGAALLGKKVRQKINVETPAGLMHMTVVKIR